MSSKASLVALKPYQEIVVNYLSQPYVHRFAAFWGMGLGKTILAVFFSQLKMLGPSFGLGAQKMKMMKTIVIAGKTLHENFRVNLRKNGMAEAQIDQAYDFWSYQKAGRSYMKLQKVCQGQVVIVDEAHFLRSPVVLFDLKEDKEDAGFLFHGRQVKTGKQAAAVLKAVSGAHSVLIMTGTPLVNRTSDIVNLGYMMTETESERNMYFEHLMTPKALRSFNESVLRGGIVSSLARQCLWTAFVGKVSLLDMNDPDVKEILEREMPKSQEINVLIEMNHEYYQSYQDVERSAIQDLKKKGETKIFESGVFYNGLRRSANKLSNLSQKRDFILTVIHAYQKRKQRGIIVSNWLEYGLKSLMQEFEDRKIVYREIMGENSDEERAEAVRLYNSGQLDVILLSSAGSTGVDLHGTAYHINFEPAWNETSRKQANGRGVRLGSHQKTRHKSVIIFNLFMCKPVNDEMATFQKEIEAAIAQSAPGAPDGVLCIHNSNDSNYSNNSTGPITTGPMTNDSNNMEKNNAPDQELAAVDSEQWRPSIDVILWHKQMTKAQQIYDFMTIMKAEWAM
jgi:hypothetical protein